MFDKRKLSLAFVNMSLAFFVMALSYLNLLRFLNGGGQLRMSHLILFVQFFLIAFFFLARYAPRAVSWSFWNLFISFTGTFSPFFFSLVNQDRTFSIGIVLQILGNCMSVYAVLSLNRSIGILPANRGIQTRGMYRFVRHPLYSSYQVANLGYIINHFSAYNLAVAMMGLISQVLRIYSEERFLSKDPDYVSYKTKVHWRMIPFLF